MPALLKEAVIHSPALDRISSKGAIALYRPDDVHPDAYAPEKAVCMFGGHALMGGKPVFFLGEPLMGPGFVKSDIICYDHMWSEVPTLTAVRARAYLDDHESSVTSQEE